MELRTATETDRLDLIGVLLLAQLALLVTNVIEALLFTAILGPLAAGGLVLALVAAVLVAVCRVGIRQRSRRARRTVMVVEAIVLVTVVLDLVLALALTRQLPPIVTILTQGILPAAILVLLRRPDVRAAIGPQAT